MASLFESKRNAILRYAGWYGCSIFVETGSGAGDMIEQVYPYFKQVYSIELDSGRYQEVKARFANAHSIKLYHGDSGSVLEKITPLLDASALIYLDAHYCGPGSAQGEKETPILKELQILLSLSRFNHVILIDDLVSFQTNNNYPSTDELKAEVEKLRTGLTFEILKDGGGMIMITPTKKKKNEARKVEQVTEKVVTGQAHPPVPLKVQKEEKDEKHKFERPPMLYGPFREGKEK